jgi:hypothetical protein
MQSQQQQQQHSIPTTYHQSYQPMTELRPLGVKQEAAKFNGGNGAVANSNNNNGYDAYMAASSSRTPSSGYGDLTGNSPPPPAVMAVVNGLAGISKQRPPRESKKSQHQAQANQPPRPPSSEDGGDSPVSSGGGEELNTKDLAQRISAELKRYSIPQAIFAQRVLCRSQGTLSDLLRNPKPWGKLKSGRETFRRMQKWLQEPEYQRMATLRLAGKNFIKFFKIKKKNFLN